MSSQRRNKRRKGTPVYMQTDSYFSGVCLSSLKWFFVYAFESLEIVGNPNNAVGGESATNPSTSRGVSGIRCRRSLLSTSILPHQRALSLQALVTMLPRSSPTACPSYCPSASLEAAGTSYWCVGNSYFLSIFEEPIFEILLGESWRRQHYPSVVFETRFRPAVAIIWLYKSTAKAWYFDFLVN